MPAYATFTETDRHVFTRTTIRPDGAIQDCVVARSGGDPIIDRYTCALIVLRAKFQQAKWVDGSSAYAVHRQPVSWILGRMPSKKELQEIVPPDMEISVDRLPQGARSPMSFELLIAVDETGRVVGCIEQPAISRREKRGKKFPELVPVACQEMTSKFTAVPARDASGKPARSVQNAWVDFITGS